MKTKIQTTVQAHSDTYIKRFCAQTPQNVARPHCNLAKAALTNHWCSYVSGTVHWKLKLWCWNVFFFFCNQDMDYSHLTWRFSFGSVGNSMSWSSKMTFTCVIINKISMYCSHEDMVSIIFGKSFWKFYFSHQYMNTIWVFQEQICSGSTIQRWTKTNQELL